MPDRHLSQAHGPGLEEAAQSPLSPPVFDADGANFSTGEAAAPVPSRQPATALQTHAPRRRATDVSVADVVVALPRAAAPSPQAWHAPERATATVWFDHTDLVHYFERNRVPTGIQRVEIEMYRATRARACAEAGAVAAACVLDRDRRVWVRLPEELFDKLCGVAPEADEAARLDDGGWTEAVGRLIAAVAYAPAIPFRRLDVLVTVGAAWWMPDYLQCVRQLQHEHGVLYAAFIHDCIPLLVPETCAADLVTEFEDWFGAAMHTADLTFANSRCTARDVSACAEAAGLPSPTPHVVRLDAHAGVALRQGGAQAGLTQARLGINRPFVLFVATIEARKDHLFVFRCWQRMIALHGRDAVPDLLCVGKPGWLVETTLNWLRVTPGLHGKIRLLGTLGDDDLAALYAAAEYCVYNSTYEGWGLPVTESLCHGRVPLVPHHSSLPEAGGSFATYFEPGSADSFIEQATRLFDPAMRGALERRIRSRFRPRPWSAVLEQIMATATRAPVRVRPLAVGIPLQGGSVYSLARRAAAAPIARSPAGDPLLPGSLARFGAGWWQPEEWGCWSRLPTAQLLFSTRPDDEPRTLYLLLRGGPAAQRVELEAGRTRIGPVTLRPYQRHLLPLKLREIASAAGDVLIGLHAEPYSLADHTGGGDPRRIGFGLEALAVIAERDVAARLALVELSLTPT